MNGNVLYTEGGAFTAFEHLYVDKFGLSYNEACKLKHAQMVDKKSLVLNEGFVNTLQETLLGHKIKSKIVHQSLKKNSCYKRFSL